MGEPQSGRTPSKEILTKAYDVVKCVIEYYVTMQRTGPDTGGKPSFRVYAVLNGKSGEELEISTTDPEPWCTADNLEQYIENVHSYLLDEVIAVDRFGQHRLASFHHNKPSIYAYDIFAAFMMYGTRQENYEGARSIVICSYPEIIIKLPKELRSGFDVDVSTSLHMMASRGGILMPWSGRMVPLVADLTVDKELDGDFSNTIPKPE